MAFLLIWNIVIEFHIIFLYPRVYSRKVFLQIDYINFLINFAKFLNSFCENTKPWDQINICNYINNPSNLDISSDFDVCNIPFWQVKPIGLKLLSPVFNLPSFLIGDTSYSYLYHWECNCIHWLVINETKWIL